MPTFTPEQLKSMTLDELERYYNLDPNNLDVCHAYIELLSKAQPDEDDTDDNRVEVLEEQVYFAQVAISNIEQCIKDSTRLTGVRKRVPLIIEESGFEL